MESDSYINTCIDCFQVHTFFYVLISNSVYITDFLLRCIFEKNLKLAM